MEKQSYMKDPEILCDICHAPMKFSKWIKHGTTKSPQYRIRVFKCTLCDYSKWIYANGIEQELIEQDNAERDSKKASNPIK